MGRKKELSNMEHVKKITLRHYMGRYWQFYLMMLLPLRRQLLLPLLAMARE